MSPKNVLLPVLMSAILAAAIANELHPQAAKVATEGPSSAIKEPDPDRPLTEANGYKSTGPSGSVEYIRPDQENCKCKHHHNPPSEAPSVYHDETVEGYDLKGVMASSRNRCKCGEKKPGPPSIPSAGSPSAASDVF